MQCEREVTESFQIFRVAGLLDDRAASTFSQAVEQFVSESPQNFILDLFQVEAIDSAGIACGGAC